MPDQIPDRFQPSRKVLVVDAFMTRFIKIGGVGVIAAVMGIFLFILLQAAPLFSGATITEIERQETNFDGDIAALLLDEWSELPILVDRDGNFHPSPRHEDTGTIPSWRLADHLPNATPSIVAPLGVGESVIIGTDNGKVAVVEANYSREFANDAHQISAAPALLGPWSLPSQTPVVAADYKDAGSRKLVLALQDDGTKQALTAIILKQKRGLLGAGEITIDRQDDLTPLIQGKIQHVAIGSDAEVVVAATADGKVHYLRIGPAKTERNQTFSPFGASPIATIRFLLANKTLVLCDQTGKMLGYTLTIPADDSGLQFVHTKTFEPLHGVPTNLVTSQRNRSFLTSVGDRVSLRYGTTTDERWSATFNFSPTAVALSGKFDMAVFADTANKLHFFEIHDKHPEAGWRAYFGKIWYEGAPRPDWTWQSTGGSGSFEPKLSMMPLIFGSIKGTVYAILFALPLALLAAVYCSQFQNYRYKALVKPTMEIMASLPSVVLGFLGALWLAPIVEDKVPAVLAFLIILPTLAMSFGYVWTRLPAKYRVLCKPGREFLFALPILIVSFYAAKLIGPVLESMMFNVATPAGTVADFRLWWNAKTGTNFEQRNALIVGFMMGFAVIPIIFTITEDALSNVPQDLRSASLALGASRWQTAMRVVLPTASPGIFSAVMIGIGRAVGETMIVLMATGNTPIMEWSIFNGMRTLSANIAVELPEAPVGGTLYRSLYMGALILFCMTFVLNTCAEVLRRHLREKYKTV